MNSGVLQEEMAAGGEDSGRGSAGFRLAAYVVLRLLEPVGRLRIRLGVSPAGGRMPRARARCTASILRRAPSLAKRAKKEVPFLVRKKSKRRNPD